MQIKRLLILMLVLLASIQGFSQSSKVNLTGVILTDSGQPAEGVSVALKGTAYSTLTNEKGEYELSAEPGNYVLSVTYVGYKSKQTKINLQSNQTAPSISIEEDMAALDEVQVTGKTKVQRVREQAFNITAVDLKQLYNTSADLNQVLNKTTGVRVRESGGMGSAFNFSLNGFSGDQVKFFLDGIPIDNYGSSFTLNNIPVNMAERIDVYKGVVPIELGGDALGGAVNIVTNKNVNHYIDASYSFGSFNTHKAAINTRFTSKKGLVANINAFANYSDNSYKVDASIPDSFSGVYGPIQKLKHFHDGYKQGTVMAEVGVKDKKYADYLLIGAAVSANKKEIQQGTTMLRVVGDAFTDSQNFVPSIKYKKSNLFTKDLTATLAASYNIAQERTVDTSSARYDWSGHYEIKSYESGGEINTVKTLMVFDVKSLQSNANLKYDLNENNSFALNYTYLGYKRKQDNEYTTTDIPTEPYINKNILGLSYSLSALEKRLSYTTFAKMLDLHGEIMTQENGVIKPSFNDLGYGTAAAYFVIPEEFQVKASYEHAFRLPSAIELLGDGGVRINPNPTLEPEVSDNVNLGFAYKKTYKVHSFAFEGNLLYRKANNFIQPQLDGNKSINVNFKNIQVTGIDGVIHYGYKQWFTFDLNTTYQKTLNMDDTLLPGTNQVNYLYKTQVPNVPIFYGNANLGFYFKNLKYTDDLFTINLSTSYAGSYYLNPPTLGKQNKKEIPEQVYYSASLAYSLKNGRYNIALECFDITDVKLYDYYNVQKPGRSFTLKLRYFFM
ncbi:TonB-dependent receptor [Flavobacterium pectinovorum]|uniref:TonB-dependent receptor plug domain-containing protein n=2 Tax=Flavobacterium pectinovorum TaxID=29533 RepID=A0AB36P265_9FLAO|nr:TonB-dependent receptor [Flavobacterium pectinovorum]OXB05896.1 hypothetical protein B0A72_07770 [Flavobacterium pectinovorum]